MKHLLTPLVLLAAFAGTSSCAQTQEPLRYENPVWAADHPDPSVIRGDDGYFYVFTTGRNLRCGRSKDLVHWEELPSPFTDATRPRHVEGARSVWAPDLERIGDRYVMYYSQNVTKPGGNPCSTVGIATAERLDGPFEDRGILFQAKDAGVPGGAIDAFYWEEEGHKYLFWGSFKGLYGYLLTDDGLAVDGDKGRPVQIAGNAYEGGMLFKRGRYYYLFASTGSCCRGAKSTYTTVVGRSESLFGPYVNRAGESMEQNRHEVLIRRSDRFAGPGHNSEIITDRNGDTWMLYHAYDMQRKGADDTAAPGRMLMLDQIRWDDEGWPYVTDGQPSERAAAPVF